MKRQNNHHINNTMQQNFNIFHQIVKQVREKNLERIIYFEQSKRLDLTTYKINNISAETVLKSYEKTWKKYQITGELEINPIGWHQNERRVFVWFMMAYTFLKGLKDIGDLVEFVENDKFWESLSEVFFGKNSILLQFQFMNMLRIKKRECWSLQEDKWLLHALKHQSEGKWNEVSKRIYFDSKRQIFRSPKHCRQRWLNHLDASKRRGQWNCEQEKILFTFFLQSGKRWSKIVPLLGNMRTEHTVKNHFNSRISKIINKDNITEIEAALKILNQLDLPNSSPQQNIQIVSAPKIEDSQNIYQSQSSIVSSKIDNNGNQKEEPLGKELKKQELTSLQIQVSHQDSNEAVEYIPQNYIPDYYQSYYPQYYFNPIESPQIYSPIQLNYQTPVVQYFTMGYL